MSAPAFLHGKRFLTSDNVFQHTHGHPKPEVYSLAPLCTDTSYDSDDYVFRNRYDKTELLYHEEYWYYLSHTDKKIYKSRFDGSEKAALYTIKYGKTVRNYVYKRLELGEGGLYFMDIAPDVPQKDYIYRNEGCLLSRY